MSDGASSKTSSLRPFLFSGVALAALSLSWTAGAQTINTLPAWNGSFFMSSWGLPNTATYGQTITPTASQTLLSGFTFELNARGGGTPQYQAFVYQRNSVNSRPTGPPFLRRLC
jgi:hypothetical protein